MKTVIIPDIHCMFAEAEEIISKENPDQVIFIGDYFDRCDDDPSLTTKVARWLKDSLKKENRIHLLGNHELWYCSGNDLMACSGNTEQKYQVIRREQMPWNEFHLHCWLDDWLVTHAGLSNLYYKEYSHDLPVGQFIETESSEAKNSILRGEYHRLFSVSFLRGGNSDVSGTLWCDINEFEPIKGLKQIFGHTHQRNEFKKIDDENYCIDCAGWYAVYENKVMAIKHG